MAAKKGLITALPGFQTRGNLHLRTTDGLIAHGFMTETTPSWLRIWRYRCPLYLDAPLQLLAWSDQVPLARLPRRGADPKSLVSASMEVIHQWLANHDEREGVKELLHHSHVIMDGSPDQAAVFSHPAHVPTLFRLAYAQGLLLHGDVEGCLTQLSIGQAVSRQLGEPDEDAGVRRMRAFAEKIATSIELARTALIEEANTKMERLGLLRPGRS
jgi:hypothetical protein